MSDSSQIFPDMIIEDKRYNYIETLGYGSYGKTYLYQVSTEDMHTRIIDQTLPHNTELYAIKLFFPYKNVLENFNKEISNLQNIKKLLLGCQAFITCYKLLITINPDDDIYDIIVDDLLKDSIKPLEKLPIYGLVTNYVEGFDLHTLKDKFSAIKWDLWSYNEWSIILTNFILQLLSILERLHSTDIIHRDIKLDNIIINDNPNQYYDYKYFFVLIDLGGTCIKTCNSLYGSPKYLSQRFVIRNQKYNNLSIDEYKLQDVYALYVTLYVLANFRYPFPNIENKLVVRDILILRSDLSRTNLNTELEKDKSNNDENNYRSSDSGYNYIDEILDSFFEDYLNNPADIVSKKLTASYLRKIVSSIISEDYKIISNIDDRKTQTKKNISDTLTFYKTSTEGYDTYLE